VNAATGGLLIYYDVCVHLIACCNRNPDKISSLDANSASGTFSQWDIKLAYRFQGFDTAFDSF
jgi:hypothetical protein